MGSNMEPVAVTSQKHDPAWKHCQMFKSGDRVQLKCVYCGKIFKGGGIHRIKEHIAGQKGNAAACLRVQPDVRQQMLESLNGVAVKKRKKKKLAEDITGFDNHCGLSSDIVLLPVPESVEHDDDVYANRDDDSSSKAFAGGQQKKGRGRKAPNNMGFSILGLEKTTLPLDFACATRVCPEPVILTCKRAKKGKVAQLIEYR